MVEIRLAEEKVMEIYMGGLVPGTVHLCQGHEAVSVGAMGALNASDWIICTYRGHHHALARGMDLVAFFAEIMGRDNGACRGMGGSSHVTDFSRGMLGSPAIIGAGIPVAVGAAMSARLKGEDRVTGCFFGDGACNIGAFHEGLNLAQVWKAPVVFVIENNLYGEYTPYRAVTALAGDIADRAEAYGMAHEVVDGQDALAVHAAVASARLRAASGEGPTLIEAKTYRYRGHSRTDPGAYRPEGELEIWKARDPIIILGSHLAQEGVLSDVAQKAILEVVQKEVDDAAALAETASWPTFEQVKSYVFAD
ncbi:MAG: thiamine pyrophosphate-dependent dehydrogenase E1 component subunit alpha [Acidimicrobiia bacterium]